jgi:hypothetical protein
MNHDYRRELVHILAAIDQKIAEGQALIAQAPAVAVLLHAFKIVAELRRLLKQVESRLNDRTEH